MPLFPVPVMVSYTLQKRKLGVQTDFWFACINTEPSRLCPCLCANAMVEKRVPVLNLLCLSELSGNELEV